MHIPIIFFFCFAFVPSPGPLFFGGGAYLASGCSVETGSLEEARQSDPVGASLAERVKKVVGPGHLEEKKSKKKTKRRKHENRSLKKRSKKTKSREFKNERRMKEARRRK